MRFPVIINSNTREEYTPGEQSLNLVAEVNRKVRAEDFTWDSELAPSLVTYCIEAIAKNFEHEQIFEELPCADRFHLLEVLATDLPLEIVVPLIEEESYWKRRYSEQYGSVKETKHAKWTWKCLCLEKQVQKMMENAEPQYCDEETMDDTMKLVTPYIHKLVVTELKAWKPPLTWEKDDIPIVWPIDHIDFAPIFTRLEFIEEFDISFGVKNVETEFTWNMFKMSVNDCKRLGKAVLLLKILKIFRLHKSAVDDDRVRALSQNLIKHKTLVELHLTHCQIGDQGALCVAKMMLTQKTLRKIYLTDNNITAIGAQGIGFALLEEECCELDHLDLRLNPLRHDGVMSIFRALVRNSRQPKEINLAATQFEELTSLRLSQVIKLNSVLTWLDVSCNWFDEEGSKEVYNGMMINKQIIWLDLRDTDIPRDILENINKCLMRNERGFDDMDSISSGELTTDENTEVPSVAPVQEKQETQAVQTEEEDQHSIKEE